MAVNIVVPEMGESVVDARVGRWMKQPGDAVTVGEPLVELETDKVDVEISASKTGVLGSITHAEGADVKIGDVLGTIEVLESVGPEVLRSGGPGVAATPSARREARERDVALDAVAAVGPRVTRADVRNATSGPTPVSKPVSVPPKVAAVPGDRSTERVRMSKRRATIAKRLVEVQATAAMLTTFNEVDMSAVMALRGRQKQAFKDKYDVSLGVSVFFVKAAIAALREFPHLNAEIQGDEIVVKHYYDIGIAVGAAGGLVVPVLRDFATKAKDNTLSLDDLRGGSFTITNGGVFGSLMSTPILNPPQVGILGLHAIKDRPIGVDGQVVLRPMMFTALTYDHRIVDGAEAVRFLVRVKELVEDPGVLLLEL
jgi:2-oxoglutarate dehydrogenase E2 component (dihydrolipoamide succinyltransferase)